MRVENAVIDYQYTDRDLTETVVYYKINLRSNRDVIASSAVRIVYRTAPDQPLVFPNPVADNLLYLKMPKLQFAAPVQAELFTANGKAVLTQTFVSKNDPYPLNLPQLSPGVYFLKLRYGAFIWHKKVFVQ